MFSCKYREIFKNSFFIERLWWLLLSKDIIYGSLYNIFVLSLGQHDKLNYFDIYTNAVLKIFLRFLGNRPLWMVLTDIYYDLFC